jgi:hypothetical protein
MIDRNGYWHLMEAFPAHLTLKLDTAEPIEIADFVGAFTSIANEFERYVEQSRPDLKADTRIYIKEVRSGCIEADMKHFPEMSTQVPIKRLPAAFRDEHDVIFAVPLRVT